MQTVTTRNAHLSLQQTRLWSLQGENPAFHAQCTVTIEGSLDVGLLLLALQRLEQQHEILHTVFHCLPGMDMPVQVEDASKELLCPVIDLKDLDPSVHNVQVDELWEQIGREPFDIVQGPPVRCSLLQLSQAQSLLLLNLSAFSADTTTLRIFVDQLCQAYTALLHNQELAEEPLQYADISAWQSDLLQEEDAKPHKEFWDRLKSEDTAALHLPYEMTPAISHFDPAVYSLDLETKLSASLLQAAQEQHVTPEAVVLTCWQLLLARLTTAASFVMGLACDGRSYEELADALGLYTRYVPLKASFENDLPFSRALTNVNRALEEAKKRQHYFVPDLEGKRSFAVTFTAEQWPESFDGGEVRFRLLARRGWQDPFLLQLALLQVGSHFQLELHYDCQRLPQVAVQRWAEALPRMLAAALAAPQMTVSRLPALSQQEEQWLAQQLRGEQLPLPFYAWHIYFEQQVERSPQALAVQSGAECWSYQQLNAQANQLARCLQAQGVSRGTLVGLCLPRAGQMIVGLLGILKAGGAYVPLESDLPEGRLEAMLAQSEVPLVLTNWEQARQLKVPPSWTGRLLPLEEIEEALGQQSSENLSAQGVGQDLAYVIYTSGTTGEPKGVMVRHRNLLNYSLGLLERLGKPEGWRFATVSTLSADLGNTAIYGALSSGGCVQVVSYEELTQAERLAQVMQEERIEVLKIVPSHLSSLLNALPQEQRGRLLPRRALILGGERLNENLRAQLRELGGTCRVYNHYGPTETTVGVLMGEVEMEKETEEVTLGWPLANSWMRVLDRWGQTVPTGVAGELYVGGAGVTAGYLGAEEQTRERYVRTSGRREERMYRTGDVVKVREDGQVVYVGRRDRQVKLRGYRIELEEIEAVLGAHKQMREAVVILREDEPGRQYLAAYMVAYERPEPAVEEIRAYLRERLPEYMVPTTLMWLRALPLTANGKIDYKQLPVPDMGRELQAVRAQESLSPVEEIILAIWQEVLKLPISSIHDNFFRLGGHSLLATQVVSRIRIAFGVDLSIMGLFEVPTIAGVAGQVEAALKGKRQEDMLPIQRVSREQPLHLSFAQHRIWFLDQLEPTNSAYNKSISIQLSGILRIPALEESLKTIVRRHEVLRTTFSVIDGQPIQVIQPDTRFQTIRIDLTRLASGEASLIAQKLAEIEGCQLFNIADQLPIRATLIKLNENEHYLLLTLHHIASDAWSNGVFVRELQALYTAFVAGKAAPLPELAIQYADFAAWQRAWLQGEVLEEELRYWREQLEGIVPLELPTDRPRPSVPTFRGKTYALQLPRSLSDSLRLVSQREGVTLFMTLLAAFQVLLSRYTMQTDIAVGTPIANRNRAEVEHLIGFFVNTLVMRTDLSGNPTFLELLKRVRSVALGAYAHQDLPFEKLVEMLQPERDLTRSPLFQVMFSLHNVPMAAGELPDLRVQTRDSESGATKFDLTVGVIENEQGLYCVVEYLTDLFDRSTVARLLDHWQNLLQNIVSDPERRLDEYPLLAPAEMHQILVEWNITDASGAPALCAHQIFDQLAQRVADCVALVLEDECLTYGELNRRANQLAHFLQHHGVGPDVLVGVCMHRSLEIIITLFAILKAGGAYLPIDPDYPEERIAFILEDAQCPIVLTQSGLSLPERQQPFTRIALDQDWHQVARESRSTPVSPVQMQHLAYVIYTSGSTGQPKGVEITHCGIGNLAYIQARILGLSAQSHELQFASFSFDASVWEIMIALLTGATLCLAPRERLLPGPDLLNIMNEQAITHVTLPPSALAALPDTELPMLETLVVAGEACPPELVTRWAEGRHFFNAYGPTEATVCASIAACIPGQAITIGRPIAQTQLYVLDHQMQPVPPGVAGELYIGGLGLARGYHKRADLTAERFLPHPFSTQAGARLYRTGDRVRYLPDGTLAFVGRTDGQVKIRGYRVELGEIEHILRSHRAVRECAVIVRDDVVEGECLVAYVSGEETEELPPVHELRHSIQEKLPDYMIPARIVVLERLPLTISGKVDRRALPLPDREQHELASSSFASHNPVEEMVTSVWAEMLGLEQINVSDNFFDLGGHSLLATQMIARFRNLMGVEMPLHVLFETPTVAGVAAWLQQEMLRGRGLEIPPITPVSRQQTLPLSFAQQRLWLLDQLEPGSAAYIVPAAARFSGSLNRAVLARVLAEIIQRHESLRTTFPLQEGQPVQRIGSEPMSGLIVLDLRTLSAEEREREVRRLAQQDAQHPFDLTRGPLLRIWLLHLEEQQHLLLLSMHHIITDGWSNSILVRELTTLYRAFVAGSPSPLRPLSISYADYAVWQRNWLQGEVLKEQIRYWTWQLNGARALELPSDHPRSQILSHRGARYSFTLDDELVLDLAHLSKQEDVTLFMVLLAAFQVLLYRLSGEQDIVVGTDSANRSHLETEGLVGFFVNLLALRASLRGNPSFKQLLRNVREMVLGAYAHQELPFEMIVEHLNLGRKGNRTPLVNVLFVMQNIAPVEAELPGMIIQPVENASTAIKFDLALFLMEEARRLHGSVSYSTDLFEESTIAKMMSLYKVLLHDIVARPESPIENLEIYTEEEKQSRSMHEKSRLNRHLGRIRSIKGDVVDLS